MTAYYFLLETAKWKKQFEEKHNVFYYTLRCTSRT